MSYLRYKILTFKLYLFIIVKLKVMKKISDKARPSAQILSLDFHMKPIKIQEFSNLERRASH
jgi:hypothetical protein